MCYSAEVKAEYHLYRRDGGELDLAAFYELYWVPMNPGKRGKFGRPKTPRAMDLAFRRGTTEQERAIWQRICEFDAAEIAATEQELFKQRQRVVAGERVLASAKPTKKASEDVRIGSNKVEAAQDRLADLKRTALEPRDFRIFPDSFCPVMIAQGGKRVVKPMRYHCRPAHVPASFDTMPDGTMSGTYNARRDNLESFWKRQFGYTHAVFCVTAFYENVWRHKMEHRELAPGEKPKNVVLEFRPEPAQEMWIACLYSHWQRGEESLWSFAAITDEPPPEVAAAGHDRCIIQIKPENIDAWLNPRPGELARLQAILDDRPGPYYQHRVAKAA